MTEEQWKPIVGFEEWYSVSNTGRIRRERNGKGTFAGRTLRLPTDNHGYYYVRLYKGSHASCRRVRIHILVAEAFIGKRPELMTINHVNGNKADNHHRNLEYCSQADNARHSNLYIRKRKLTPSEVAEIRSSKGIALRRLGQRFGVSKTMIRNILINKSWKEIA